MCKLGSHVQNANMHTRIPDGNVVKSAPSFGNVWVLKLAEAGQQVPNCPKEKRLASLRINECKLISPADQGGNLLNRETPNDSSS